MAFCGFSPWFLSFFLFSYCFLRVFSYVLYIFMFFLISFASVFHAFHRRGWVPNPASERQKKSSALAPALLRGPTTIGTAFSRLGTVLLFGVTFGFFSHVFPIFVVRFEARETFCRFFHIVIFFWRFMNPWICFLFCGYFFLSNFFFRFFSVFRISSFFVVLYDLFDILLLGRRPEQLGAPSTQVL